MREKFARWMYGRYGVDRLSKHLVTVGFVISLVSVFIPGNFVYLLGLAMFIYSYYRIFSKNLTKRYAEARGYERLLLKVKGFPARMKSEMAQRKEYHIFSCPSCKQKIRIPKGRGTVEIKCQKCSTVFRKKS